MPVTDSLKGADAGKNKAGDAKLGKPTDKPTDKPKSKQIGFMKLFKYSSC